MYNSDDTTTKADMGFYYFIYAEMGNNAAHAINSFITRIKWNVFVME